MLTEGEPATPGGKRMACWGDHRRVRGRVRKVRFPSPYWTPEGRGGQIPSTAQNWPIYRGGDSGQKSTRFLIYQDPHRYRSHFIHDQERKATDRRSTRGLFPERFRQSLHSWRITNTHPECQPRGSPLDHPLDFAQGTPEFATGVFQGHEHAALEDLVGPSLEDRGVVQPGVMRGGFFCVVIRRERLA